MPLFLPADQDPLSVEKKAHFVMDHSVLATEALCLKVALSPPRPGSIVYHPTELAHRREVTPLLLRMGWSPSKMGLTTAMAIEIGAEALLAL